MWPTRTKPLAQRPPRQLNQAFATRIAASSLQEFFHIAVLALSPWYEIVLPRFIVVTVLA